MRRGTIYISVGCALLGLVWMGGCTSAPAPVRTYQESAGSALVFDPPVIASDRPVELSRDERRPGAFIGYEDTSATYYDVHTYDHQADDGSQSFERDANIEKVGVSYR